MSCFIFIFNRRVFMFVFILFSFYPSISGKQNINEEPCEVRNTVDLTDSHKFHDGNILKDGITFPPKYVFTKNVSGEIRTLGCLCKVKNCLSKCCSIGSVMYQKKCTEMPAYDLMLRHGMNIFYFNGFKKNVNITTSKHFGFVYGRPCADVYLEDDGHWFLQEDGKLYIELPNKIPPWIVQGPDKYCIDTFVYEDPSGVKSTQLDALACFTDEKEDHHYVLSSTCMIISCIFILATVGVYMWLPELRNLHGRVLMAYLLCLFVAFAFLATMQILLTVDNITLNSCLGLTFVIYYSLLAAFFWLNVMCFDIWWTFSGKRGLSLEKLSCRARFYAYSLYAFGIPTALTILLAALEFSGLPSHPLLPSLRHQGCFIYGNSKLLYLYGPIVILCLANMMFFILTAVKIAKIKQQTSVLKSKESATHDQHRNDKQRLLLYVKLFAVMGVNWLLEVVSAIYPEADDFWVITDAYNVLIGFIIFVIFVCKRKIFRLMKKRYKQLRGEPMSRSQTTTSRTLSSKDEIKMNSVKRNSAPNAN